VATAAAASRSSGGLPDDFAVRLRAGGLLALAGFASARTLLDPGLLLGGGPLDLTAVVGLVVGAGTIGCGGRSIPCWSGASSCSLSKISLLRWLSAISYSFVMVSARVGQASMHSPQKMQRR
jgi:hypothetical protein